MTRAIMDPREEPAFFEALMEAMVYAHIPLTDHIDATTERVRFLQFHRPEDGQLVLPFFTDQAKAVRAAQTAAQVLAINGRYFLELTRGATLMLDPNDTSCVLYPEEVETLLQTGRMATIQSFTVQKGAEPCVGPIEVPPAWLVDELTRSLAKLPFVEVAYLAGTYIHPEEPELTGLVIALGGDITYAERAVHALASSLQPVCEQHSSLPVDMTHFDVEAEPPNWITELALQPIYDKSWGTRLHQGQGTA